MPRVRAELRGRLRYRARGPGPRLSFLHVRLSAAAARALWCCGQREGGPGPLIAFQGSQGRLMVPGGPRSPPQVFVFSLSRCSQDEPWGSLECVRLAVSWSGQSLLNSLGSIQEKITVCAMKSARPPLREPTSLAKEPHSRAVVEANQAVLGYGKGVTTSEKASVNGLLCKGTVCHILKRTQDMPAPASASLQSLFQPQALLSHRAPEFLQRLEGMQAGRPGKAQLPGVEDEDTELDPAACGVKSTLVGQEQDGPRNVAWEQPQAALLQRRSQDCRPSAPSFLGPQHQSLEHSSPQAARRNIPGVKHLALLDFSDLRASKRSWVSASSSGSQEWHWSCTQVLRTQHLGAQGQQPTEPLSPGSCAAELESLEDSPEEEDARSQPHSSCLAEIPDYLWKYHTICSVEQCRAYEAAFSADYSEYRCLHARIGNVRQKFIQLGAKMMMLKQGTEERKALEATIMHEYRHLKTTYPSYQQEKQRCEYLHLKLSHIKSLILQFEGSVSS